MKRESYFPSDKATLDDAARTDLDVAAVATQGLEGYMIEVAGYASRTGTKQLNQKLSADRAAAVVQYLRTRAKQELTIDTFRTSRN